MAVLGAVLVGPAIATPPSPAPDLDHFRCYSITVGHPAAPPIATLEDQFDKRLDKVENVFVGLPIGFCNPVAKTIPGPGGGPGQTTNIQDPNAHLILYEIHETTTQRHLTWKVTVDNQFGRQTLFATKPVVLGVPTQKVSVGGVDTGLDAPEGLNHFKCYEAKGRTLNVPATLVDQFETAPVLVVEPLLFCNPVEKTVSRAGGSEIADIEDPEAHLTCYNIHIDFSVAPFGGFTTQKNIGTVNQFNHIDVEPLQVVTDERVLCVPSTKSSVLGIPGSLQAP
jgi:hypothetical protein